MNLLASNPLIQVTPGLMIWTIVCFGITYFVLKKFAFGRIQEVIDERRKRIREALDEADRARSEAQKLVEERQRRLEETSRQIEAETARALQAIRSEVADLTVIATEKVTGKVLTPDDHKRLIDEAIGELDFSALQQGSPN